MSRVRDLIAFAVGKALVLTAKVMRRDGHHIPGRQAYQVSHGVMDFIAKPKDIIFVTGTNGKSTTTALVSHLLTVAGKKVAHNTESNTQPGITTALLKNVSWLNRPQADVLVLEVGEEALPKVMKVIKPTYLLTTNVQKDTFQVNCSPNYIWDIISSVITDDMTLFVNNDDPGVLALAAGHPAAITYGVERNAYSAEPPHGEFDIAGHCPICHAPLVFDYYNIPTIGRFHCTACDFASREKVDFAATGFDLTAETVTIGDVTLPMHYTAAHFVYDYLLAYAFARRYGIGDDVIKQAFDTFVNIGGRLETQEYHGMQLSYSRFKQETPDTVQSAIDFICLDKQPKTVVVCLQVVDNEPWGPRFTETFYSYDCSFEKLADANVTQFICCGEYVAHDTANRLLYAGVARDKILIVDSDEPEDFLAILRQNAPQQVYIMTWLHTYKEIKKALGARP